MLDFPMVGVAFGGILGKAENNMDHTVIIACVNAGYIDGHSYVGGILGMTFFDSYLYMEDCINVGVVKG